MKKTYFLSVVLIVLTSCATYKLDNSVWSNLTFVEKNGKKADLTTSLHFVSDRQVDVICSVVTDSAFIVEPFKYAEGTYTTTGNPKKEVSINIDAQTIDKKAMRLTGRYHKNDGMILTSQDSITKIYFKLPGVKIQ